MHNSAANSGRSIYHALLIGIERHASGSPLGGCVNDIDAIQALLLERLRVPANRITRLAAPIDPTIPRPTEVVSSEPSRANLIAAFTALAADTGPDPVLPGDRVLIYYSGHGAQRYAISAQGARYWREALVPTDNRTEDDTERLLFDWEVIGLLTAIAARTSSISVVLDCCNSAGAARDWREPGVAARHLPPATPGAPAIPAPTDVAPIEAAGTRRLTSGTPEYMVVAACLDTEVALESGEGAERHGELTRALVELLCTLPDDTQLADLRWGEIWRSVAVRMEARNPNQHPWHSGSLARRVFGGPSEDGDVGYAITFDAATATYTLDVGDRMDVTRGAQVAVYDRLGVARSALFSPLNSAEDLAERRGILTVTEARDTSATAMLVSPASLAIPGGARGRLLAPGEDAKLIAALAPDDPLVAGALFDSKLVRRARPGERASMTLTRRADGMWAMVDAVHGDGQTPGEPTLPFLTAAQASSSTTLQRMVEHYYRWTAPLRLAQRCLDLPHQLTIRLLDASGLAAMTEAQLQAPPLPELHPDERPSYSLRAGVYDPVQKQWTAHGESFCIRLENSGDDNLWVTLLACEGSGSVSIHGSRLLVGKHSQTTAYLHGARGSAFDPVLFPPRTLGVDRMVAIGTTSESATLDHLAVKGSFMATRDLDAKREYPPPEAKGAAPLARWTADIAVLRLHK